MADELKIFQAGEKITADETNDNNRYLLGVAQDTSGELQNYIKSQLNQFKADINTQISSINTQISAANANIASLQNAINSRVFTRSNRDIGTGTTSLSSYLPNDNNQYLVFLYCDTGSYGTTVKVNSDICSAISIAHTDHDSGRATSAAGQAVLPVGAGRTITCSGAGVTLRGYMRV